MCTNSQMLTRLARGLLTAAVLISPLLVQSTASAKIALENFPHFLQPDGISCGPTCASMVLKWYGINAGIGPLKTRCHTRFYSGPNFAGKKIQVGLTIPEGVERGLEYYGVPATVGTGSLGDVIDLINQRRPPILLVRSGVKTWHYVVACGYDLEKQTILLSDPGGNPNEVPGPWWISAATLDQAWMFASDLHGNATGGRTCHLCAGQGQQWTNCPACGGRGKISGTVLGRKVSMKCLACGGQGRWSAQCPACGGSGAETDFYRKIVETVGVSGHTMIVPDCAPEGLPPGGVRNQPDSVDQPGGGYPDDGGGYPDDGGGYPVDGGGYPDDGGGYPDDGGGYPDDGGDSDDGDPGTGHGTTGGTHRGPPHQGKHCDCSTSHWEYDGGCFKKSGQKKWIEYRQSGPKSRFVEVRRTKSSVELWDAEREMFVRLENGRGLWHLKGDRQWKVWTDSGHFER